MASVARQLAGSAAEAGQGGGSLLAAPEGEGSRVVAAPELLPAPYTQRLLAAAAPAGPSSEGAKEEGEGPTEAASPSSGAAAAAGGPEAGDGMENLTHQVRSVIEWGERGQSNPQALTRHTALTPPSRPPPAPAGRQPAVWARPAAAGGPPPAALLRPCHVAHGQRAGAQRRGWAGFPVAQAAWLGSRPCSLVAAHCSSCCCPAPPLPLQRGPPPSRSS